MSHYDQLIKAWLAELNKPLPKTCAQRGWPQSRECRLAGGCPVCYAEILPSGRRKMNQNDPGSTRETTL